MKLLPGPRFFARELPLAYVFFAALTLAVHASHLTLPLFGDEGDFYGGMVRHFHETGFHLLGNPGFLEIYHPPLYYVVLGLLTLVFGWKFAVLRVAAALSSALLPVSIYGLARLRAGRVVSAAAALAFTAGPLYLGQSISLHPDILAAAFVLTSLLLVSLNRRRAASVAFLLAMLTNASSIVAVPALAYLIWLRTSRPQFPRRVAMFFLPAFTLSAAWCCYFLVAMRGWGDLGEPVNLAYLEGAGHVLQRLFASLPLSIFFEEGRVFLSLAVLACLLGQRFARGRFIIIKRISPEGRAVILLLAAQLVFLAFFGWPNQRYAAISIAMLFVVGTWAVAALPVRRFSRAAALMPFGITAVASLLAWTARGSGMGYNMRNSVYFDNIRALERLASVLDRRSPRPVIYTEWPWSSPFTSPYLGYVSKPFEVVDVGDEKVDWRGQHKPNTLFVYAVSTDPPFWNWELERKVSYDIRKDIVGPCEAGVVGRGRVFACPLH